MHWLHLCQGGNPVLGAPGSEVCDRLSVGLSRVAVAQVGCEELQDVLLSILAELEHGRKEDVAGPKGGHKGVAFVFERRHNPHNSIHLYV